VLGGEDELVEGRAESFEAGPVLSVVGRGSDCGPADVAISDSLVSAGLAGNSTSAAAFVGESIWSLSTRVGMPGNPL
jgi:hypothetical protein